MSTEVSIAKPISGPEALESCIDSLRKALSKDDRLGPHMAYSGFRAVIHFQFSPQLSFIPDIERHVDVERGETNDISETATVDERVEVPLRSPNQVRQEAGLPQPILVTDSQGRSTEKWIKHDGNRPTQGVPRNKVIGGK